MLLLTAATASLDPERALEDLARQLAVASAAGRTRQGAFGPLTPG
ncbi:MAG: hypothetical protein ACOCYE_11690 [Pseudomonadota bacterium]